MTTALTIIEQALKKINVLGRGQSLDPEEAQDALRSLNNILDSWSIEGNLVYTQTRETFNLTSSASYTVGSGADFDTVRPFAIEAAFVTSGTTDYKMVPISQRQYADIEQKDVTGIPEAFYYDNNQPTGTLFLYPKPSAGYTITIYSRKPLSTFASLSTDVTLPSGYERALILTLAVEMSIDYGRDAPVTLQMLAEEAKDVLFAYNTRNDMYVSGVDAALLEGDRYNIYTGN